MMAYLLRPFRLFLLLLSPHFRQLAVSSLRDSYHAHLGFRGGVTTVPIGDLIDGDSLRLVLERFGVHHGNMSYMELFCICALVRTYLRPGENFLEIGTFDGNTISNVALNIPADSTCYTIDLPIKPLSLGGQYLAGDKELVDSRAESRLKHRSSKNVVQFYSDSAAFDFSKVTFSGAFIDGGHHYELVKKDTENILRHMKRPGFVLWHDYYGYNDVARVIHELPFAPRVRRITGTNLCFVVLGSSDERG
jgi:hypothetical protein